jgi:UrcA family protein
MISRRAINLKESHMHRFALIALATFSTAGAALAQPPAAGAPDAVSVRYAAHDLADPAGARNIALRIRVAANRLCGGEDPVARSAFDIAACRQATEAHAAAALAAPLVSHALGLQDRASDLANR